MVHLKRRPTNVAFRWGLSCCWARWQREWTNNTVDYPLLRWGGMRFGQGAAKYEWFCEKSPHLCISRVVSSLQHIFMRSCWLDRHVALRLQDIANNSSENWKHSASLLPRAFVWNNFSSAWPWLCSSGLFPVFSESQCPASRKTAFTLYLLHGRTWTATMSLRVTWWWVTDRWGRCAGTTCWCTGSTSRTDTCEIRMSGYPSSDVQTWNDLKLP